MERNSRLKKYLLSTRILAVSTIFQRGKIVVPIEVRRMLGVKDGDKLTWTVEEEKIYVKSAEQTR